VKVISFVYRQAVQVIGMAALALLPQRQMMFMGLLDIS
jgi:hypothetical protein